LTFYQSVGKVTHGLNITTAMNKYTIVKELMCGQALQQFNDGYNKQLNAQYAIDKEVARAAAEATGGNAAA
jgi:hypothetical protein